ncbi:MAG: glutathione peroxidase [Paludibacterium sp.]|uniref:glutathione peroxidase n=1 Tax=Paludibacterium sp. TaxID=1917523 RepID=UPI0025E35E4F|nr:glutathione peroxidase [Paludibacterium sp.]MBV8048443.1 glutathione peroxidase [Paludibacterium sp.]MBV8647140.1 glutathione peroxidase [Paludibacterium sp.]
MRQDLFQYEVQGLDGQPIDLPSLRGKVVLVVNTASRCGFTPQFAGLQALYQRYRERGLVVLGFPCNQFGHQDPGSHDEIGAFCQKNYGVDFPMAERIEVNGAHAHPLWRALKRAQPGLFGLGRIHWNFTKFLIDREGRVVARFAPMTKPSALAARIEALL